MQLRSQLTKPKGARDRVKALTETVRAFESGLEAMRDGPCASAAIREEVLLSRTGDRAKMRLPNLLGVLQSMNSAPVAGFAAASVRPGGHRAFRHDPGRGHARTERPAPTELRDKLAGSQRACAPCRKAPPGSCRTKASMVRRTARVPRLVRRLPTAPTCRSALPKIRSKPPLLIASTETLEGFASGLEPDCHRYRAVHANLPDIIDRKGTTAAAGQGPHPAPRE